MKPRLDFSLVDLPRIDLAGVSVPTDMQRAQTDCRALWEQSFMPKALPLLRAAPEGTGTYGLSFVKDMEKGSFIYWAAFPWDKQAPEGMKTVAIPAGTFVTCTVGSLQDISLAYTALFSYVQGQPDLDFNPAAPSVERYPAEYPHPETLHLYVPVKKNL